MAYGVRYRAEWRATTRSVRDYVIDILQDGYTGEISPIYLTGDCFTLTYGAVDESELQPIKSSEAEISVLCTEEGNPYMELYTLSPLKYKVMIYEDEVLIWSGFLASGNYTQPLAKPPYMVKIRANDGVGTLKSMPYRDGDGNKYQDGVSVSALINRLMAPIADHVDIWNYHLIKPKQGAPTFDIISIPESAIYTELGDDASYYDVLEAVLENFGVQITQCDGVWCVRSIGALATAVNSKLLSAVALDGATSSGYGVSSDATLTMLSPIRKMTTNSAELSGEVDLSKRLCNPTTWVTDRNTDSRSIRQRPSLTRFRDGLLRIKAGRRSGRPSVIQNATWNVLPELLHRSQGSSLSVTFDLYNERNAEVSALYMGLWLVEQKPYSEIMSWRFLDTQGNDDGYTRLHLARSAIYYNATSKAWTALALNQQEPNYTSMGLQRVVIPASQSGVNTIAKMSKVSMTYEMPDIPVIGSGDDTISDWYIVIVTAIYDGASVIMDSPRIVISSNASGGVADSSISVSSDGIEDSAYSNHFYTSAERGGLVQIYKPLLLDLDAGKDVYGYLEAVGGVTARDAVGKMMRDLRSNSTKDIEGDVDKSLARGINNVVTHDGNYYYTNYLRYLAKRGVSSIQLRELPMLSKTSGAITFSLASLPNTMLSLDKMTYALNAAESSFVGYHLPNTTMVLKLSTTSSSDYSPQIRNGVGCVVLADADGVRAFDDNGKMVAEVSECDDDNIGKLAWVKSAVYDIYAEKWIASAGSVYVATFDKNGYLLDSFTVPTSATASSITGGMIYPYRGGFVYKISSSAGNESYWHGYTVHKPGTFEASWAFRSTNVIYVNDGWIVKELSSGQLQVHKIDGVDLANTRNTPTIASISAGNEFIEMNGGIMLTRGASGAAVYDFRNTTSSRYYLLNIGGSSSPMTLCGDVVYAKSTGQLASRFDWKRVLPKWSSLTGINQVAEDE